MASSVWQEEIGGTRILGWTDVRPKRSDQHDPLVNGHSGSELVAIP